MKLRDYYFGRRITLISALAPEEIKQRIKAATKGKWLSLPKGPAGGIRWGRIHLYYGRHISVDYNAKPILVGPVERTATGSVMPLVYRGSNWWRLFFVLFYVFIVALTLFLAIKGTQPPLHGAERLGPFLIPVLMAAAPFGLHYFGTRQSDQEFEELLEFLERVAEAKPSRE